MAKKIIGCDIDGVLANWNASAHEYFVKTSGKDLVPADQAGKPPCWNWPKHYGWTDEECAAGYGAMSKSETFWAMLAPLPYAATALITMQMNRNLDVYFITTRGGYRSKWQTEVWLEGMGYHVPTVLIAMSPQAKGLIAAGLGLTHMIDDRPENCTEVLRASPQTQVFCLSATWNVEYHDALQTAGVTVVDSLETFIKAVKN